jgi:hypothetical protein
MSLGTMKSAMRMRDIIKMAINEALKKTEPQMGQVASIDRANRNATVVLNGDTAEIDVKMFRKQPLAAGDIVRVSGSPGRYVISDVLSSYGWEMAQWMQRLQSSIAGGGTVAFASNNFTWTVKMIASGAGRGPIKITGNDWFFIGPCVGGIPVPRYNSSNPIASTTVANGVTINQSYETLYYELPLDNDDPHLFDETRFRLVGIDGTDPFDVPPHWLMIATRDGDATPGVALRIANGKTL